MAVIAGFVIKPEDWKYSSAQKFCRYEGLEATIDKKELSVLK